MVEQFDGVKRSSRTISIINRESKSGSNIHIDIGIFARFQDESKEAQTLFLSRLSVIVSALLDLGK